MHISLLKSLLKTCPTSPGVYIFKDSDENIIYIGKAKNLKDRVSSYFRLPEEEELASATGESIKPKPSPDLNIFKSTMVEQVEHIEYIATTTESEALLLECNLIKKHRPVYNIRLKDDTRYPYIAITADRFPMLVLSRRVKRTGKDKAFYIGPFTSASKVRKLIKTASSIFKLRLCKKMRGIPVREYKGYCENREYKPSEDKLKKNGDIGFGSPDDTSSGESGNTANVERNKSKLVKKIRPCLNYDMGICSAPCAGKISQEEYASNVRNARLFLTSNFRDLKDLLTEEMEKLAESEEYEKAIWYRDALKAIDILEEEKNVERPAAHQEDYIFLEPVGSLMRRSNINWKEYGFPEMEFSAQEGELKAQPHHIDFIFFVLSVRDGKVVSHEDFYLSFPVPYSLFSVVDTPKASSLKDRHSENGTYKRDYLSTPHLPSSAIAELITGFLSSYYSAREIPSKIFIATGETISNDSLMNAIVSEEIGQLVSMLSSKEGRRVEILYPRAGRPLSLMEMASKNALLAWERKMTLSTAKESLEKLEALDILARDLGLPRRPEHIEGFDISNLQGAFPSGSTVVFRNGVPSRKEYRHYSIRLETGGRQNDFAMIKEIVFRRYLRLTKEQQHLPDLIVIDGGPVQLEFAVRALAEAGIDVQGYTGKDPVMDDIPAILSLAKGEEAIYMPVRNGLKYHDAPTEQDAPTENSNDKLVGDSSNQILNNQSLNLEFRKVLLPLDHPGMKIIQQVRDEAHRFALRLNRIKREGISR